MSNIKATETVPAIIISDVDCQRTRDAGATAVSAPHAARDVIKSLNVNDRDAPLVTMHKVMFYEGGLMREFAIDLTEAQHQLGLASAKNKTAKAEDKREPAVEDCYSNLKRIWSQACDAAGLPKSHNGGNRGAESDTKATAKRETVTDAPITVEAFHVPTGLDSEDVYDLFTKFADGMRRTLSANAATVKGDAGSVFRKMVDDMTSYLDDAKKALEADKPPVDVAADARRAILAELAAMSAKDRAKMLRAA